MANQNGPHLELHLESLNRCTSLIQKHISPTDLSVPDGRYASVQIDLKSSLAFTNLSENRLEPAQADLQQAVGYLQLQQKDSWSSGKVALYLLYGLAITYDKLQEIEKATAVLDDVLALARNIFEEHDPRIADIQARIRVVAQRASLNPRHHKAIVVVSTDGDVQRLPRESQYLDTSSPRADESTTESHNEVAWAANDNNTIRTFINRARSYGNFRPATTLRTTRSHNDFRSTMTANSPQVPLHIDTVAAGWGEPGSGASGSGFVCRMNSPKGMPEYTFSSNGSWASGETDQQEREDGRKLRLQVTVVPLCEGSKNGGLVSPGIVPSLGARG